MQKTGTYRTVTFFNEYFIRAQLRCPNNSVGCPRDLSLLTLHVHIYVYHSNIRSAFYSLISYLSPCNVHRLCKVECILTSLLSMGIYHGPHILGQTLASVREIPVGGTSEVVLYINICLD